MYSNQKLVKSILGDQVFEALNKSIVKLGTRSVVDIGELHAALNIAPKSIVAFLMKNIASMKVNEAKEINLPWDDKAFMLVNKKAQDVYMGHIAKNGQIEHEFDNCSIPQLSAHILSAFELYDEVPGHEKQEEKHSPDEVAGIKAHLQALEAKINALIMLAVSAPPQQLIQKSQKEEMIKAIHALKKAGIAPSMPKPPRPGVHSGSQQGIAQSGFHGDKTASTDSHPNKVQSAVKLNPQLKTGDKLAAKNGLPQQPKQPKLAMTLKSENASSKCLDCGEPDFVNGKFQKCSCFKAMSNPTVKKSEASVTFSFGSDWDDDNRIALWHSLKKVRK